jgi:hypothetical protein
MKLFNGKSRAGFSNCNVGQGRPNNVGQGRPTLRLQIRLRSVAPLWATLITGDSDNVGQEHPTLTLGRARGVSFTTPWARDARRYALALGLRPKPRMLKSESYLFTAETPVCVRPRTGRQRAQRKPVLELNPNLKPIESSLQDFSTNSAPAAAGRSLRWISATVNRYKLRFIGDVEGRKGGE